MSRKKVSDKEVLKYRVETRVNVATFKKLEAILQKTQDKEMSGLLREILSNRPIQVYTYDKGLDIIMEELSALRVQIKAIGVNINQITRFFNTYPEPQRKQYYGKIAFQEYKALQPIIERIMDIVTQLSKKWLSE
jgi:hypothetical protein